MKRRFLVGVLTLSCIVAVSAASLPYRHYGGKYPYDIEKVDGSIKRRLKQVLGRSYSLFERNNAVQVPCVVRDNYLVIQGCRAHYCNTDNSFAIIDVNKGTTYAGIVSNADTKARKVKVFPAHEPLPRLFRRLMAGEEIH